MTATLIFIKHKLSFLWFIIEWFNSILFKWFYRSLFDKEVEKQINNYQLAYTMRQLNTSDINSLKELLQRQSQYRLKHFNPHGFDGNSLSKVFSNQSLILLGVFQEKMMVGYFFLRCFMNKQCFVGRLVDEANANQGIGKIMNKIMYNSGWNCGFRVMSTISKNNTMVMQSHKNNKHLHLVKELPENYLLVEFRKEYSLD